MTAWRLFLFSLLCYATLNLNVKASQNQNNPASGLSLEPKLENWNIISFLDLEDINSFTFKCVILTFGWHIFKKNSIFFPPSTFSYNTWSFDNKKAINIMLYGNYYMIGN